MQPGAGVVPPAVGRGHGDAQRQGRLFHGQPGEIAEFDQLGLLPVPGRKQLQRLLKLVCEDKVAEIAITYEDRLTRFGQEFLETLFACFGVRLTVLDPGEEKTPEQE